MLVHSHRLTGAIAAQQEILQILAISVPNFDPTDELILSDEHEASKAAAAEAVIEHIGHEPHIEEGDE